MSESADVAVGNEKVKKCDAVSHFFSRHLSLREIIIIILNRNAKKIKIRNKRRRKRRRRK